ncbi:MAG: helicase, partial [Romboutsia sp.]
MSINNYEWNLENEWLQKVLKETTKQLGEKRDAKNKLARDAKETQRELWNDLGSVSIDNGIDKISEFVSAMDVMKYQKRS